MKQQNPALTASLRNLFGDTAVDAVKDLRCIKEPMGCGKPLPTVCGSLHDPDRGPCVLTPRHDGACLPVRDAAGTPEAAAADRRISAGFRDDASVREWMLVGMCQPCQDRFERECAEAEAREEGL
jgi:hypothetical protein